MRIITFFSNLKNERYDEALANNQGFGFAYPFEIERNVKLL